jgi:hypothetical protein
METAWSPCGEHVQNPARRGLLMPAAVPPGGKGTALSLRGWAQEAEAAAGIAKALAPTPFIPEHLRVWVNPEERNPAKRELDYEGTVATVAAVLLAGQELGLEPMASLRSFVIIRGTVAMFAVAARALLLHHGHEIIVKESNSTRAVVVARRADSEHWQTAIWDLDRAKTAGLFPGHVDGNWRKQTKAMLVARASAEAARWVAADALLGLPLIAEEVEDAEHEIPPAIEAAATGADLNGEAKTTAKRRAAPKRAALPAAPPDEPPPGKAAAQAAPPGPKITKPQLAKLHAGLKDLQITGPEEGLGMVSVWAGRQVDSTGALTTDEAHVVLTRIDALLTIVARPPDEADDEPPADAEHQADDDGGQHPPDDPEPPPPDAELEANPP